MDLFGNNSNICTNTLALFPRAHSYSTSEKLWKMPAIVDIPWTLFALAATYIHKIGEIYTPRRNTISLSLYLSLSLSLYIYMYKLKWNFLFSGDRDRGPRRRARLHFLPPVVSRLSRVSFHLYNTRSYTRVFIYIHDGKDARERKKLWPPSQTSSSRSHRREE